MTESYPTGLDAETTLNRIIELREADLSRLNVIEQNSGYTTGLKKQTTAQTADFNVSDVMLGIEVDASGAAVTATLPASPRDGHMVIVVKTDATANNVTLDGNGNNINGAATLSWNTQYESKIVVYFKASDRWYVVN